MNGIGLSWRHKADRVLGALKSALQTPMPADLIVAICTIPNAADPATQPGTLDWECGYNLALLDQQSRQHAKAANDTFSGILKARQPVFWKNKPLKYEHGDDASSDEGAHCKGDSDCHVSGAPALIYVDGNLDSSGILISCGSTEEFTDL